MSSQTVMPADIEPAGWVCEHCNLEFQVGDIAHNLELGMTPAGDWVVSHWVCERCNEETP